MRERLEQPVRAFEHRARPEKALLPEARGLHPGLRGPACVQALGPRAFGEVFDDAGRKAAGDAERIDRLAAVEPERDRCRRASTPIVPRTLVGWKPALWIAFGMTIESRHRLSMPATIPTSAARPSRSKRSHTASTAGATTALLCTGPPSNVSSKSSPCAAVPLMSAA